MSLREAGVKSLERERDQRITMACDTPAHRGVCGTSVLWENGTSLVQGWFPEAVGRSGGGDFKMTPLPPEDGVKCPVLNCSSFGLWRNRWNTMDTPHAHLSTCCCFWMCHPEDRRGAVKPAWCCLQLPAYRTPHALFSDVISLCTVLPVGCAKDFPLLIGHREEPHIVRWLLLTCCDRQGWVRQQLQPCCCS